MALTILPSDVAEEIKNCAEKASLHCAKVRMGGRGDADAEKVYFEQHAEAFKMKAKGLLGTSTCDDIKNMFWFAAWHTANTRVGYKSDAARDERQMNEYFDNIVKTEEMTRQLATDIKWLGWNCAWHAANTLKRFKDDAKRDEAKIRQHFQAICGEVNLVSMNFFTNEAKILQKKPKVIAQQRLENNVSEPQVMKFSFSVTQGKTESTTTQFNFKFGVKVGFGAKFFCFAEGKYELSLEFSAGRSWSESISSGISKNYEFPLTVPGHKTYVAKAIVNEAEMEVPYEMVFDFNGSQRLFKGMWKGVAVSTATYRVDEA